MPSGANYVVQLLFDRTFHHQNCLEVLFRTSRSARKGCLEQVETWCRARRKHPADTWLHRGEEGERTERIKEREREYATITSITS